MRVTGSGAAFRGRRLADIRFDAKHHALAQRDTALGFVVGRLGIGGRAIFPDQIARLGIEREDILLRRW